MGKQLQKINQGQAPTGAGGDSNRTQSGKINSNVDVLNSQAALNPAPTITDVQALTADHIGKRVNIQLADDGVIRFPPASVAGADCVMLLRNTGATVVSFAPADGAADTVALSKLNPAEAALVDTDGAHAWSVLMRGRAGTDNETVNGDLTVRGGGSFGVRPSFNGNAPWDTGNLKGPLTAADNLASLADRKAARANLGTRGKILISEVILTGAATSTGGVDFDGLFTSEFTDYEIEFSDMYASVTTQHGLGVRWRRGGAYVASANYVYGWGYVNNVTQAFGLGSSGNSLLQLCNGQTDTPGCGQAGTIRIRNPLGVGGVCKHVTWDVVGINGSTGIANYRGGGFFNADLNPFDGVGLFKDSGVQTTHGKFRLYGIR